MANHIVQPSNFSRENLKKLHELTLLSKQRVGGIFENSTIAVAILDHACTLDSCTPDNFHWFKLKPKHNTAKLKDAYLKKNGVQIILHHASTPLSEETQMRQVVGLAPANNTLVFTSEAATMEPGVSSPTSTPLLARNSLQPINSQLPSDNTNPLRPDDAKTVIKAEEAYSSPFIMNENDQTSIPMNFSARPRIPAPYGPMSIKSESKDSDVKMAAVPQQTSFDFSAGQTFDSTSPKVEEHAEPSLPPPPPKNSLLNDRIQKLMAEGTPEALEAEVKKYQAFLEQVKQPISADTSQHKDAQHWVQQIETLQKHNVHTPTIIGVVGNTGAGKSSVINAMLEEERLVPTNCMRACTSTITEMSWNSSSDENEKYRAEIEFIRPEDWKKDLELSLNELLDPSGQVSRDCTNAETEAGVAYAKIKAVYPHKTKEELASCSADDLMQEPSVKAVLGTIKNIAKRDPDLFYRALQLYVDSKEKATAEQKVKEKREKKGMEFWPLIKVVRLYTKSDCLSTGAVIVDLPGVHDSNAARAAVAAGYMKTCTGLFIVAPINRAVDDKAAKSLLGESFKRQMKFDGTYSRITFICSKTDDISLTEATDSLGLQEKMSSDWATVDELEAKQRALNKELKTLRESKGVYQEIMDDADDKIEQWDQLNEELDEGKTIYAPGTGSKKRKRASTSTTSRKKFKSDDGDEDHDDDEDEESASEVESDVESSSSQAVPLTAEDIENKLATLKEDKKNARSERGILTRTIKDKSSELAELKKSQAEIETAMTAVCIEGRNSYSKSAIQRDFADGIRELDQEAAQEENPDQFNPEDDLRNYDEVARSLPVFCVSSRAYQKLQGRLVRDNDVPGFRTAEETEVPQLQAHCKKLTEAGRASNCRAFLTDLCRLLTSLGLWAANDGTGVDLSNAQLAAETRFLKDRLKTLEKCLEGAVRDCLKDIHETLSEQIFENLNTHIDLAIAEANVTASKWHLPVNRADRSLGGYYWSTYKAIMRREGVYSNAQGPHDFNADLIAPVIKHLGSHWEKCFQKRLPRLLSVFTKDSKNLLTAFHREVELRSMKSGTGTAGMMLLSQQLQNYGGTLLTLSQQMNELINGLQRDANREFTPVIARTLSSAYEYNANEHGSGCFARMKSHMNSFVDEHRNTMFAESCDDVKQRLILMCKQVEEFMAAKADEIFLAMQRDYMEVISGTALPKGQMMPKWERNMRADVAKAIEDHGTRESEADAKAEEAACMEDAEMAITSEGNEEAPQEDAEMPNTNEEV